MKVAALAVFSVLIALPAAGFFEGWANGAG
jgi:hypothetical protein